MHPNVGRLRDCENGGENILMAFRIVGGHSLQVLDNRPSWRTNTGPVFYDLRFGWTAEHSSGRKGRDPRRIVQSGEEVIMHREVVGDMVLESVYIRLLACQDAIKDLKTATYLSSNLWRTVSKTACTFSHHCSNSRSPFGSRDPSL